MTTKSGSIEDDSVPALHSPVADAQDSIEDEVSMWSELFAAHHGHCLFAGGQWAGHTPNPPQ